MQFIFQNKLALRVTAPISLEHALKKIDVNLINHSYSFSYSFVESLCWKICRENQVACILSPFDGSKLHFIYQNAQRKAVEKALMELKRHLPVEIDENIDEDVVSNTLMAKAVESSMISALLNQGWTSLGNGLTMNGDISFMEEGAHMEAISVIKDFLPTEMEERFDNGHEVNLEDWLWHLRDDSGLNRIRCFVLPSLMEGCILGLSKLSPQNKDFQESKQLWLHKNGLEVAKDCFYINVQFTSDEEIYKAWFPSSLVFKGSGLMPVAHTIRVLKVVHALENFRKCIADWNFFDGGTPNFQGTNQINSSLEACTWVTAKDILQPRCFSEIHKDNKCTSDDCTMCSLTVVMSNLDFRRSKPFLATVESRREDVQDLSQRHENQFCICPTPRMISKNIAKIVPHFINHRIFQRQNVSLEVEPAKFISPAIPREDRRYILKAPSLARRKPSSVQKKEPSTNKVQCSDGLMKDFAAILNKVEPDKFISPAIPTEDRQYIVKALSFARRKPSAAILQKNVKAETKNTSFGSKSKAEIGGSKTSTTRMQNQEIGGSATATIRIQNGEKVSKKKLSETDMKAIPICLKKVPNKEREGSSSGSKNGIDFNKESSG